MCAEQHHLADLQADFQLHLYVDIASTACCIREVDIVAAASSLLRHDKSRCSPVRLLRVGESIPVIARLPTVVADGKATLLLRLLPWLLPWVLLLLLR